MKRKKLATLTDDEDVCYSNAFEFYLRNVRNNSKRADRYAWRHVRQWSPRLKQFDGAKP